MRVAAGTQRDLGNQDGKTPCDRRDNLDVALAPRTQVGGLPCLLRNIPQWPFKSVERLPLCMIVASSLGETGPDRSAIVDSAVKAFPIEAMCPRRRLALIRPSRHRCTLMLRGKGRTHRPLIPG